MKDISAVYFLPIIVGIPTIWLTLCKGIFETTAKLTMLGSSFNCLRMLFRQVCQFGFIASIHYWINELIKKHTRIPTIFPNLFFYGIYFELFGFGLYDFEFIRLNMQAALPSIFQTYLARYLGVSRMFVDPLYNVPNAEAKVDTASNIIKDSISDSPVFWITTIVFIIVWIILQIVLVYINRSSLMMSARSRWSNKIGKVVSLNGKEAGERSWETKYSFKDKWFVLAHVLAILHIFFAITNYFCPSDFNMTRYSFLPFSECIFLSFSHFEKRLSMYSKTHLVNLTRRYLPPGRRWLDNRPDPVYPAVHGDMAAFCAYNSGHEDCKNFVKPEQKPLTKLPNVVFLIYESLTPSYYLITKDFIREHASIKDDDPKKLITSTPYYNPEIVKNLAKYQKYGVTFSGMTSLGIPTASGWHGLMTGTAPAQTFGNIIDGAYMHSDDLPSQMMNNGYRSFYVSASLFNFDGSRFWVWRRSAEEEAKNRLHCEDGFGDIINDSVHRQLIGEKNFPKLRKCSDEEVQELTKQMKKERLDFPKWFDYAFSYTPSRENAPALGLDPETIREDSSWPGDRLTAAETITHWQQQKRILKQKNESKPIFGAYLSIESHIPYYGYDKPEFYEDKINESIKKDDEKWREARFIRVNKYGDQYQIGHVLDWLKENDPNTIFVITGDHGTRDIPIRERDMPIFEDIVYSSDCVHHSSGIDSFFVTSGMIGYLGNDSFVKQVMGLDKLAGKTVKVPTDHNDLVFTLEDILNRINGTTMQPTHRRNRNLIDLSLNMSKDIEEGGTKEALEKIDQTNWTSFSITSFNAELREGSKLLRTHPADKSEAHYYEHASYPMCLRKKGSKPMKLGTKKAKKMYDRLFRNIQSQTYLQYHNRLYNYGFRDNECINKGKCTFPEPEKLVFNDSFFFILLVAIPTLIMLIIGFSVKLASIIIFNVMRDYSDQINLNDEIENTSVIEEVDFAQEKL